jgi:DNA-binding NarL/FixJ family response regulator
MSVELDSPPVGRPGPSSDPIRILLVDDHPLVRTAIRDLIDAEPDLAVVGEAGNVTEAVRRIGFDEPDVVLLDLDLPGGSGIDVCNRVQAVCPTTRVIILTGFADETALAAARSAGASGFILKRVNGSDLLNRVRRVAHGGTAFDDAPEDDLAGYSDDRLLARLTARERAILELIADGKTNREIADELYLAEKTVKNYVSNLLMKMDMRHRAGAAAHLVRIQSAYRRQYPPSEWRRSNRR